MAYPGTQPTRTKDDTAWPIRRELGKGMEVLRKYSARVSSPADAAVPNRETLTIPDIDLKIVDIKVTAQTQANCDLDLVAPIAWDTAPGATNELMATINASDAVIADDVVSHRAVLALGARVVKDQPILVVATDDTVGAPTGQFYIEISCIPADDEQLTY